MDLELSFVALALTVVRVCINTCTHAVNLESGADCFMANWVALKQMLLCCVLDPGI